MTAGDYEDSEVMIVNRKISNSQARALAGDVALGEYDYYPPMTDEMLKQVKKAAAAPAEDDPAWETIDELKW